MRICLVSSELAPFHGWGVGTAVAELARALLAAGHQVHLLVDDLPGVRQRGKAEFPGVTLHILGQSAGEPAPAHGPCLSTRRPLAIYRQLKQLHATHRFEYIGFNDFYADAYFTVQAKRTIGEFEEACLGIVLHSAIFLLREINSQAEYDLEIGAITHMEQAAMRGCDLLIAPCRAMVERLAKFDGVRDLFEQGESKGAAGRPAVRVIPNAI